MHLFKYTIIAFFCTVSVFAQNHELGKVTKAELEEKAHPKDPSAPAAVLFSKRETAFNYSQSSGFEMVTEVEMKIKIYTKEGYKHASQAVYLYNNDTDKERIDISKAYTYNLVNGKVEKTKLKSEGEFMEQVGKNVRRKKIMLPDVKEGSIIEFRYVVYSPFFSQMPDWSFQQEIPVAYSSLTTRIPQYYTYSTNVRGYFTPIVNTTKRTASINSISKERSSGYVAKTTFSQDKLDYMETVTTYELSDLPALKDEAFVGNPENYISGIEHELSMISFPDEPVKMLSTTWEEVAKTIYKRDGFGDELSKTGYFEDDIKALVAPLKTPDEKINAIFNFVKERINWNGNYGILCDNGVKKAYKEKTGDVAEINLMLTAMLNYAGLEAYPVLVCSRSQKISLFPNRGAFDYVICAVKQGDKVVLLDATSKHSGVNTLPSRVLYWNGLMIDKNGHSTQIPLSSSVLSKEITVVQAALDASGKCTGKARVQYTDNNALDFRDVALKMSKESYLEKKEKRHTGLEISEVKFTNEKDLAKPVVEDYDFTYNNAVDIIGDKMYVNPLMYCALTQNPFKLDKREYPIDFIYPQEEKYTVSIALPAGYVIESLPKITAVNMEDNLGSFKYSIQGQGDKVQLLMIMDLNQAVFTPDYYQTVKDFFGKMVEKQTEKIVLKKA